MPQSLKKTLKSIAPEALISGYHYMLAFAAALRYRFPSRSIFVVAVTGTKGKTTVTELVNSILEEAGFKTALAGTLRFKIGKDSKRNLHKMTMPGRFFMQKFLRQAVEADCHYSIIEMTSEGVKQFRHKWIELDSLIFTNLSPEHIESHGSYENYVRAKLELGKALEKSNKGRRVLVVNKDDKESGRFLALNVPQKKTFSLEEASPYLLKDDGLEMALGGGRLKTRLLGIFNIYNILAAVRFAESQNISPEIIKRALEKFEGVAGRVQFIDSGQSFGAVVDYAHTPDSLKKLYQTFPDKNLICVLGNTGGGRDKWKRKEMAKIAEQYCSEIILTNEDPYDEDPRAIVDGMADGMKNKKAKIIMDRRKAIQAALKSANPGDIVLITGKGTDPYIMGPAGSREEWDDATVVREELERLNK